MLLLGLFRLTIGVHFVGNFSREVLGDAVRCFLVQLLLGFDKSVVMLCVFLLRAYRLLLGPLLGGSCRFVPSCSHYAEESVRQHGGIYGLRLSLCRLSRCHPFVAGGYDPVPQSRSVPGHPTNHGTRPRSC